MADILNFPNTPPPGLYMASGLPQRGSVAKQAFGSGWPELDSLLKFYRGQLILVSGIAGHGKSTFVMNVLLKLAREKSVASFMYVPENEHYLVEKMRLMWTGSEASFEHFCQHQCYVQSAIPHEKNEPPHTIQWVLDHAAWAVNDGAEMVLIDPWNELDRARQRDEMMTDYIGRCLHHIKDFCRTMDTTVIIVAHPTKAVTQTGGVMSSLADTEGSMNWYNKCDNGIIIRRDNEKKSAIVTSSKVREIGAGNLGSCEFMVDRDTGIFTPVPGSDYVV